MNTSWPQKYELFGVNVSATTYDAEADILIGAAQRGGSGIVAHTAVHPVITASRDADFRSKLNRFDIIAPDGQPVRWALRWLHGVKLPDRVYGPEMMLRLCRRASEAGVGIYLYGSSPEVVESLRDNLTRLYPLLRIAGYRSPPFRPLTAEEDKHVTTEINDSGAGIVFIGLSSPLQELFAYQHRESIKAVQVCVGAAFDFHAGNKKMAPPWMQRIGMEWLYRLGSEPSRLWRRYLYTNSLFLWYLSKGLVTALFTRG